MNVLKLADELRTEGDAYAYLETMRWGERPICPHCGSVRQHYFLTPANGKARKTRTGAPSERRVWKCADCRKQFSAITGTIMHGSKIPVRTWIFVIFEHTTVDHEAHEYVREGATTNNAEGYFAQLKRSLDGTHHHVSVEHLDRYLAEFDFRFTTCKATDTERVGMLVGRVGGRRLMYREPAEA